MAESLRLLVVDDSVDDRFMYRRLLRERAFNCDEADSGATAIQACLRCKPDCILLDYNLPDQNGLEVVAVLREHGCDVPVVMVTGQGNEEVAVAAMKLGVEDYLVKGAVTRHALEGALRSAVEKARLRRQLEEQRQALMESHRELERFACMVAHDLQNPLSSMRMLLTVLRRMHQDADPQQQEILDRALESSDRMRRLISDLLEFSRVGAARSRFEPVDLGKVVREALVSLQAVVDETGARVDVQPLPIVRGDRAQLGQVLQNLLENALRYHGGRPPEVTVMGRTDEDTATFEVSDRGIGIAPEDQERIFEPFERLHRYDEIPGNGLGLAICKKVVEYHGGTIALHSIPGAGTTITLTLPR